MLKTAGKYAIVKRDEKEGEKKTDGGIILHPLGNDDPHTGVVVSHPDMQYDGKRVAYLSSPPPKEYEGHDILNVDAILCVIE